MSDLNESGLSAMPSATADEGEIWAYLEQGIVRVMTRPEAPLSPMEYISLHSTVNNYCTSTKKRPSSAGSSNKTGDLPGGFLYHRLSDYLADYVRTRARAASELEDVELLIFYTREWEAYSAQSRILDRLFNFINRHWVKRERDEGNKGVYPIDSLAYIQWKKHLLPLVQNDQQKLTQALLNLVGKHRNGGSVDLDLVKKTTASFISVDIDSADLTKPKLDVYKKNFEDPFLAATGEYYTKESSTFISLKPIPDYLAQADRWLREEEDLVERYLHPSTRKLLLPKCEDVLIQKHLDAIWAALPSILDSNEDEPRINLYLLLSRNPTDLESFRTKFSSHVEQDGRALLLKLVQASPSEASSNVAVDPKAYTHTLIDFNTRYSSMITQNFGSDTGFQVNFKKTFKELVNRNSATDFDEKRSAEVIGQYARVVMNGGPDVDSGGLKKSVANLSQYLENKDAFKVTSGVS